MELSDFKPIPEHPSYLIAKDGRVWSTKSNKLLSSYINNKGYRRVGFTENNVVKQYLLHRLLARVYLGLPSLDSELEVDHIDADTANNELENLQVLNKQTHMDKTCEDRGFIRHENTCCIDCGISLPDHRATRCKSCSINFYSKTSGLTENLIVEAVTKTGSWVKAAKLFNISDNGLRKAYKRLSGGKDPKLLKSNNASIV